MKKISKLILILISIMMVFQLTACNSPMNIIDKADNIEKIEVFKRGVDEPILLEQSAEIEELVSYFSDVKVSKDKKTFQETWNSMGSGSTNYRSLYYFKVTTKDGLIKKSEEYTITVGRESTNATPKITETTYTSREGKKGTISQNAYVYIRDLFIEN